MNNELQYGKTAFIRDCRGKNMLGCMIVDSKPCCGWRRITKADSKAIVFSGHSSLKLPSADLVEYVGYSESNGRFLRIFERDAAGNRKLKHLYALRKV